ncbi:MAG: aconitase X, partial [Bacilli bacterium]
MYEPKMKLTAEQQDILVGKQGEIKAKIMETIVMFGDIFEAPRLVPVTHHNGHLVTSFGIGLLKPLFKTMDRLNEADIKTLGKFTVDPRPLDFKNVKVNLLERLVFSKILYSQQKRYE